MASSLLLGKKDNHAMNTATVSNMRENFDSYLRESKGSPVFVVEDGQPVAVLLPVSEKDDMERISLAYNPRFRELIDDSDKRIEKTGGIGHNDFWESV